ncbi:MAG: 1-acyl-sn-glycerol-3-phosphate acyltransferase [Prolixibacteraceae bacterium]|jgi:putative hemolysin|nr:1-acyl-sn-glycerol-3-phosphate acyltransferase [Prolixibacteraceae bacterium]
MEENPERMKPIVVRDIFMEKNPKLAKAMPGFVYRLINRIMHIREINEIISQFGHLTGVDFVHGSVSYFNVNQKVAGDENLPESGRFIFASNHPLGGFDSMLLMEQVYRKYGNFRFLVNDVLMSIKPLQPVFVPLNKHGALDRNVIQKIENEYAGENQILIFPSGFASRKIKGEIQDFEWKKHFIAKAIEYQRDVIPVHISGKNTGFFYWLANFRTFIGIKWNLEMFLLPDEMFRQRNRTFTLTFGKPIPWQTFDKSKTQNEWAEEIRQIVYKLPSMHLPKD